MTIEASILLSISSFDFERKSLPNMLHSIARQRVPFPFELCVIDDCSGHNVEEYINKFFEKEKVSNLKRIVIESLKEKAGFTAAPAQALKLTSPESQKMVILASDSILLQDMAIVELTSRLAPRKVVFSEVAEVTTQSNFHTDFEKNANDIICNWRRHLNTRPLIVSRQIPNAWLFFVGAALKKDLLDIKYDEVSCDAVLWQKMMPMGFTAEILTYIRSVHQAHQRTAYPCPRVAECGFYCSRTHKLKGIPHPLFRIAAAIIFQPPQVMTGLSAPPSCSPRRPHEIPTSPTPPSTGHKVEQD